MRLATIKWFIMHTLLFFINLYCCLFIFSLFFLSIIFEQLNFEGSSCVFIESYDKSFPMKPNLLKSATHTSQFSRVRYNAYLFVTSSIRINWNKSINSLELRNSQIHWNNSEIKGKTLKIYEIREILGLVIIEDC